MMILPHLINNSVVIQTNDNAVIVCSEGPLGQQTGEGFACDSDFNSPWQDQEK
jgi:hypothetical protein